MRKNEWEKVCQLLELYSDEPPPPVAETKSKGNETCLSRGSFSSCEDGVLV